MLEPTFNSYLVLAGVLFSIGAVGVFLRRSVIAVVLSIQVMLNGVWLTLLATGRYLGTVDGQVAAVGVMVVAAAQAVVAAGAVVALVRHHQTIHPDEVSDLRW